MSTHEILHKTIAMLWGVWLVYWIVSARNTKAEEQRESGPSRRFHYGLMFLGAAILTWPDLLPRAFNTRQFTEYETVYWLCTAMVAAGLVFACAARAWLGSNWSATVTLKQGHELIRSGPYRYVRHPIYTGLLLAVIGTALETGAWRGAIAFVLFTIACVYKIRTEEQFMTSRFGDEYRRYQAEVPALVPFWP